MLNIRDRLARIYSHGLYRDAWVTPVVGPNTKISRKRKKEEKREKKIIIIIIIIIIIK